LVPDVLILRKENHEDFKGWLGKKDLAVKDKNDSDSTKNYTISEVYNANYKNSLF
jgi:hypothetical protein